jgi:6-pyruvoyl-tetrahydropterin synthase
MTDPIVRLVRSYTFEASHMGLFGAKGVQSDVFTVEIHVGLVRSRMKDGVVLGLKELDVSVAPVFARLRGKRLDLLEPRESFEPLVSCPTTENLALYLWDKLQFLGNSGHQRFLGVRVNETAQLLNRWSAEVFA